MITNIIPENRRKVAVLGGTGGVGKYITRELLKIKELSIKIISRNITDKKELKEEFESNGGLVVSIDYTNYKEIKKTLENVDVLISTLGDASLYDVQKTFIKAAADTDVKLFIPSEFGVDIEDSDDQLIAPKLNTRKELQKFNLNYILYNNGFFIEYLLSKTFGIDIKEGKAEIVGKGESELTITSLVDVAKFIAQTYYLPEIINQKVNIVGENTTLKNILNDITEVTKTPFQVNYIPYEKVENILEDKSIDFDTYTSFALRKGIEQGLLKIQSSSNNLLPNFQFTNVKQYINFFSNQLS